MNPSQLRALLALAAARKARDLALLDRLQSALRAFDAEIAEAVATPARDLAAGGTADAPLALQGRRQAFADHQAAVARRAQAALARQLAAARAQAVESLGKHSALEHLLAGASRHAAAQQEARAERDAPGRTPEAEG